MPRLGFRIHLCGLRGGPGPAGRDVVADVERTATGYAVVHLPDARVGDRAGRALRGVLGDASDRLATRGPPSVRSGDGPRSLRELVRRARQVHVERRRRRPCDSSTQARPPWSRAKRSTSASPMPVPCVNVPVVAADERLEDRLPESSGTPGPSSVTTNSTPPSAVAYARQRDRVCRRCVLDRVAHEVLDDPLGLRWVDEDDRVARHRRSSVCADVCMLASARSTRSRRCARRR